MRRPARLGATILVLLLAACATAAPRAPVSRSGDEVPDPPPAVNVDVTPPEVPAALTVPWLRPRPHLRVDIRPPESAVRLRSRRSASGIEDARRRLEGAWSFVYGGTIGMAIFDRSGRLLLQAVGGEEVVLRYLVEKAPGSGPGHVLFRPAAGATGPAPSADSPPGERPRRFRALFKWRSTRQVDLQVPREGEDWPEGFGPDRYRLFRDVEAALRFLRRSERRRGAPAREHRVD